MTIRSPLLVLGLNLATSAVYADHPSLALGEQMAGPVTTLSAVPMSKRNIAVGLIAEYQELDGISNETLSALGEADEDVHSVDALWTTNFNASYGVTNNFTLGASIPYVHRANIREPADELGAADAVSELGDSGGIGDLRLFGQYRFLRSDEHDAHTALLAGIKTPTGDNDELVDAETDDGHVGEEPTDHAGGRFEAEHQPGSGSWDPFVGIAHSHMWGGFSLHGSLLYSLATKGTQDTDLGDSVHYGVAAVYHLSAPEPPHEHDHPEAAHSHAAGIAWDAMLEINGEWRDKQEITGESDGNSGGNLVFLSPGIRSVIGGRWAAALSVGIPIVQDLNGTQSEPEWRTIASLAVGF